MKHTHHLPLFYPPHPASSIFFFRYLVSCPFSWERTRGTISLSVEKREDIILLRTRHKVKYRRHKRRTRPWTSLVLRIGTNEEEKKKERKTREKNRRRKGAPTGYSYRRGADERDRRAGNLPVALCSFYTRPSAKSLKRLPIWAESRNFNRQHQPPSTLFIPSPRSSPTNRSWNTSRLLSERALDVTSL